MEGRGTGDLVVRNKIRDVCRCDGGFWSQDDPLPGAGIQVTYLLLGEVLRSPPTPPLGNSHQPLFSPARLTPGAAGVLRFRCLQQPLLWPSGTSPIRPEPLGPQGAQLSVCQALWPAKINRSNSHQHTQLDFHTNPVSCSLVSLVCLSSPSDLRQSNLSLFPLDMQPTQGTCGFLQPLGSVEAPWASSRRERQPPDLGGGSV